MKYLPLILLFSFACNSSRINKDCAGQNSLECMLFQSNEKDRINVLKCYNSDTVSVYFLPNILKHRDGIWLLGLKEYKSNGDYGLKYNPASDSFWFYSYKELRKLNISHNINKSADSFITSTLNQQIELSKKNDSILFSKLQDFVVDFYETYYLHREFGYRRYVYCGKVREIQYSTFQNDCEPILRYGININSYKKFVLQERDTLFKQIWMDARRKETDTFNKSSQMTTMNLCFKNIYRCRDIIILKIDVSYLNNKIKISSAELVEGLPDVSEPIGI